MKKSGKKSSLRYDDRRDPLEGDLSALMRKADWKVARFELTKPKTQTITMRVSKELLQEIKGQAKKEGLDYTKLIRLLMENYVRRRKAG